MDKEKLVGIILIIIGIAAVLVMTTADLTGLGGYPGFGPQQTAGVIAGVLLLVAGAALLKGNGSKDAATEE